MNRLVVGVIGHVDHGKTALVRALTGIDTDRLAEEKRRGVSIELGFAHFAAAGGAAIDLIDMPGHERFIRTMVAGAAGIDTVLVVVAADEGVRPQTREHVEIARLLGVRRAVLAISKADLAGAERIGEVSAAASDLLSRNGLAAVAPVLTSAAAGRGIAELAHALAALAAANPPPSGDGLPFFPIDRVFAVAGHGVVATGTLRGAAVGPGDTLELLPGPRKVRVRTVQVHGAAVAHALPGQRVALNLRDVAVGELARGMALAGDGSLSPQLWLTLAIAAAAGAPPLRNGLRLRALLGTGEVEARLRLLDRDVLDPGEHGFAQLHCAEPVALPAGEHVILRLPAPVGTVAGGRLIDPLAQRLRRHDPAVLARLSDLRDLPVAALPAAEIERAGAAPVSVAGLARLCALAPARIESLLSALPVVIARRGLVLRQADVDRVVAAVPALLEPNPAGLSRKQLLAALPATASVLLDEAIAVLARDGAVVRRGSQLALPRPDDDRARERSEAELAAHLAETLRQAGLSPPNPAAIVHDAGSRRAVARLLRAGAIVRAIDRAKGREMLFHREAITQARARLAPLLAGEDGLLVSEISATLGITRKFTMPLLAHLDAVGFTRRVGDRRFAGRVAVRGEPV